jgi:hypothetical protein
VKHFHVYDTTGEVMCVDADAWELKADALTAYVAFFNGTASLSIHSELVATFNWSNVVCVREEEDDDEGETAGIPPVFSGALN